MSTQLHQTSPITKTITTSIFFGLTMLSCVGNTLAAEKKASLNIEVSRASGNYIVTTDGKQTYVGISFWEAMTAAAGNPREGGSRIITVRASGITKAPVRLFSNTTLNWKARSPWDAHLANDSDGAAILVRDASGIHIKGLNMTTTATRGPGMGIRLSNCPGARIEDVFMDWKGKPVAVGIRVDQGNPSDPRRVNGVFIRNIEVRNMVNGAHGVETMGVNNVDIDNVVGRNLGGNALLVQAGSGGKIGTVKGYGCGANSTSAALRFANKYSNCVVKSVIAEGQGVGGRGLFILEGTNITVEWVDISYTKHQGIFIQNGQDNKVLNGKVRGSEVRVSSSPGAKVNVELLRKSWTVIEGKRDAPLPR
jgi:hypothetical protein